MSLDIDQNPTAQRLRWLRHQQIGPSGVMWFQLEAEWTALLEENRRLQAENERLKAIVEFVDLKRENEELKAKLAERCAMPQPVEDF